MRRTVWPLSLRGRGKSRTRESGPTSLRKIGKRNELEIGVRQVYSSSVQVSSRAYRKSPACRCPMAFSKEMTLPMYRAHSAPRSRCCSMHERTSDTSTSLETKIAPCCEDQGLRMPTGKPPSLNRRLGNFTLHSRSHVKSSLELNGLMPSGSYRTQRYCNSGGRPPVYTSLPSSQPGSPSLM